MKEEIHSKGNRFLPEGWKQMCAYRKRTAGNWQEKRAEEGQKEEDVNWLKTSWGMTKSLSGHLT